MSQTPTGPVALVLTFEHHLSVEGVRRVSESLRAALHSTPLADIPIVVLDHGVHLHAVQAHGAITGTSPLPDAHREAVHAALLAATNTAEGG